MRLLFLRAHRPSAAFLSTVPDSSHFPFLFFAGLTAEAKAEVKARQGVSYPLNDLAVVGPDGRPVPRDGSTLGEIVMRGNVVMKGYHKDQPATEAAFEGAPGAKGKDTTARACGAGCSDSRMGCWDSRMGCWDSRMGVGIHE